MNDLRKPALGLQWTAVLSGLCFATGEALGLAPGGKALAGLMAVLFVLFTLASFAIGLRWFRHARANGELLTPGVQPFGPGFAAAGWLVPWLSLVLRWPITLGLWRATGIRSAPALVHLWCATSLAATAAVLLTRVQALHTPAVLAAATLGAVHPLLFAAVVRRITAHQAGAPAPAPTTPVPVG